MEKVTISNRALTAMVSGIERFPDTENGGILLGIRSGDKINVIEAIEAGKNAIHERGRLLCDVKSVEYNANIINGLYEDELMVIGIWHKHNNDYNPPFSTDDNLCHKAMCDCWKQDILSVLFQKKQDDEYSMRVFRYRVDNQLVEEEFEIESLEKMITYRSWG